MRRTAILSLGAALCALALAGPASAQVQPAGTGEPLFTNSTQNTQWLECPNSCSMGTQLGRRAHTTIDRSKPAAAIQLATGAAFVKDGKVPVRVDFSDDVAGPFPANFLCFRVGGGPCDTNAGDIYGYNASCSVPGSAGKATTFSCTADYGAMPDGSVSACVIAADASIPDNPNGPNQTATADKANLSNPSCDDVVVDRTPPAVSIAGATTTVKVGDLVSLQASVSDATSGLAGAGQWTWGDNTGGGSGDAVTHTFTQPGTYEVALTVADAAGNTATAKKAITVTAVGGGSTTPPGVARRRPRPAAARRSPATPSRSPRSTSTRPARRGPAPSRSPSSSPPATPVASSSRSPAGIA